MKINNFYISWLLFSICIYVLLLFRDLFVTIYIYVTHNVFYVDFSFGEAFSAGTP